MTQFLVRKTHHTTEETFTHVTKARENETFAVVEAESKEEAERIAEYKNLSEHFIELSLRKDSE